MKKLSGMMAALLAVAMVVPALGYVPPSDTQVADVLADHTQLNLLLADANSSQIADVVARALNEGAGTQATALLYTRALLLSGEKAPQMAGELVGRIDQKLVPVLAAATAIAVGSNEGPVFDAMKSASGEGAAALAAAAADPASVLDEDTVALVQQLVIELRGVAAAVIPPPATAPMNLIPPVVPQNETAPTPPPVAPPYQN